MEIVINIILGILILSGLVMIFRNPKEILLELPLSLVRITLFRFKLMLHFFFILPFYCLALLIDWIWKTDISKSKIWDKLDPEHPRV